MHEKFIAIVNDSCVQGLGGHSKTLFVHVVPEAVVCLFILCKHLFCMLM